ncbi:hypothetical protein A3C23_04900 [Candidatus Roizmanbacteria bacterium RIFCSPHIGHO2_02_FULL_37_13b]|uniref:Glycosyl transferase family 1 domain-containing protein n=1 Tax=Candidatus Roizmanbacteria bacterium RIFCSPLOWO2_02_FULL_36_11 TaxID=1802071 RepID=A0A1F7JCV3_9BACT|nr:MAG: hypothetical protein A3C23_04900 [Candidatus Roizmanbacteria bacterium RIFCSPHIGHO2_02_FULL_37_13b]OGK53438.1 MAG: hypothetical protein A3H78_02795 [Candidatus Roizmanbacteria bacterium RIFCSPLOWO2_02_FULL_36_11]
MSLMSAALLSVARNDNYTYMTIGIDISMLVYQGSGVANYTYNLVINLLKIDKKNHYRLFYSSLRRPKDFKYLDEFRNLGARVYEYPFPSTLLRFLWGRYDLLPVELLIGKVDVFYSSDLLRPPLMAKTRGVTTVHDLTWKIFPQYHTEMVIKAHERKIAKTIKHGDIIITDSENTKKDLIKYFPEVLRKNKIFVIYPGVDERFRPISDQNRINEIFKKYRLDTLTHSRGVLLYVGAIEPRKNLKTAIKVFHQLINSTPEVHTEPPRLDMINDDRTSGVNNFSDFKFLIVSKAGWKNEDVYNLVAELKLENKIKFINNVSDDDLPYFYNGCTVFIYLSKYEGFGLPPLEALMCNKPVLTYKNSSIQEILAKDYPAAEENQELTRLRELINMKKIDGKNYRQRFSWISSAEKILKIINNAKSEANHLRGGQA